MINVAKNSKRTWKAGWVADWAGLDMSSLDWSFRGNKQLRTGLTGQGRVARANHTEAVVVAIRRISCLSQDAGAGQ